MNITADGMLSYILAALGGFLLKYLGDRFIKAENSKEEKAKKYDEQEMKEIVIKIVKDSCTQFREEMASTMNDFRVESSTKFDYGQKMYGDAVGRLDELKKEFKVLQEQDIIFYRYLLIDTCKDYISRGSLTQYQFDRLTEWYKIYKALGGNNQGDLYYKKAVALPIIQSEHTNAEEEFNSMFDYEEQTK